jgi:hypothetical protein
MPQPGATPQRNLGLPGGMDRIVSHRLHRGLEELVEPHGTAAHFGWRRGQRQPQAIGPGRPWGKATRGVRPLTCQGSSTKFPLT